MPIHLVANLFSALVSNQGSFTHQLIIEVRLPRVVTAFVTGGLLALAGTLMQVLLRNPLADPYILGISSGASVTTLLAIYFGIAYQWLPISAFVGALASMIVVISLAKSLGSWSSLRLLLTGIIVASGLTAVISLILILSSDATLHSMLFWLLGDISASKFPTLEIIILLMGMVISLLLARQLNILHHGEKQAQSLGIKTELLQFKLYFLSALLTASAVSLAGAVGFIGLIVPHIVRGFIGSDHRYVIPAAILAGGSLLTWPIWSRVRLLCRKNYLWVLLLLSWGCQFLSIY